MTRLRPSKGSMPAAFFNFIHHTIARFTASSLRWLTPATIGMTGRE